jgi:A/G-specific adenine glycosylase
MFPPNGFAKRLLRWTETLDRPLPWRGETDPYRIWLSEVLLQQTRAEQAAPYYRRFTERYPTVHDLANAPLEEVLKLWEGLGYYNRARNLHRAAQEVSTTCRGTFPNTYEGLRALPGVGAYTAAAIASFAFGLPHPVVDGNVIRVIARLAGMTEPVDQASGKAFLEDAASRLMGRADPADYNQAIMDFGAVHCTPRQPKCGECPFRKDCTALALGMVERIPVKKPRAAVQDRHFLFLVPRQGRRTWLVQRGDDDVWRRLYTFPFVEYPGGFPEDLSQAASRQAAEWAGAAPKTGPSLHGPFRQLLSHRRIHAWFAEVEWPRKGRVPEHWIDAEMLNFTTFAFPRTVRNYLEERSPFL